MKPCVAGRLWGPSLTLDASAACGPQCLLPCPGLYTFCSWWASPSTSCPPHVALLHSFCSQTFHFGLVSAVASCCSWRGFSSSPRCSPLIATRIHLHCSREIGNLPFPAALVVCLWRFYLISTLSLLTRPAAQPSRQGVEPSSTLLASSLPCPPLFSHRGPHGPSAELCHRAPSFRTRQSSI